ncbi:RsfA family transcriptional regulator [Ferroacidibacillus organovorans]|nr:RsfA family transcriptional regulator [Ferroacidibacillus organovorans]KYP79396.1 hypothetical protein AYJ22_14825 [Ferroacidibacillus organovorans]OAG90650.1 hypothetical protein AYW79_14085 [Ferroacidibacillus organovorans]
MKTVRQDAWTEEDDIKLADIILRHIQNGGTQLAAFDVCAEFLGRTPAACGYRWNACVRKLHLHEIDAAKQKRKERKDEVQAEAFDEQSPSGGDEIISWNAVFRFLRQRRHELQSIKARIRQIERDSETFRQESEKLRRDKTHLLEQLGSLENEHAVISEDYRTLLGIVERARKLQWKVNDVHSVEGVPGSTDDENR